MTEYRDYENGVADVLAFLVGESASVERNVYMWGTLSRTRRQIDIRVAGQVCGSQDGTLIVDCKRWGQAVDVADVGAFLDLARDVGAKCGLVVTTVGVSRAARERARSEPGEFALEIMTLEELQRWMPPGTFTIEYRVSASRQRDAERELRKAGCRASISTDSSLPTDAVVVRAFRHFGTATPSGEVQSAMLASTRHALERAHVDAVHVSSGITIQGGTPAHNWLHVAVRGIPTDLKVLASTEEEAEHQLDGVATYFDAMGVPRSALSVIRPEGWPSSETFRPAFLGPDTSDPGPKAVDGR